MTLLSTTLHLAQEQWGEQWGHNEMARQMMKQHAAVEASFLCVPIADHDTMISFTSIQRGHINIAPQRLSLHASINGQC